MANYTELNISQMREILAQYSISDIKSVTAMNHGISNTNYQVLTENKRILVKVSNDKGHLELLQEQILLQQLRKWGFIYSILPFTTCDGELIYQWEDKVGVVYPFIEGNTPTITTENLEEIGRAMAQLHETSLDQDLSKIRSHTEVGFNLLSIHEFINSNQAPSDFSETFKAVFPDGVDYLLKMVSYEKLPKGVIHADLYYDNTLFRDNHLVAVLDFEQAGVGTFLFDIGVCISGSCLDKNNEIDIHLINSFIKGYQQFRQLEDIELNHLKEAILVGLFSIARWRISRFNEKRIADGKEDSYKELIERALIFNQSVTKV